jgi:hypothetical protein
MPHRVRTIFFTDAAALGYARDPDDRESNHPGFVHGGLEADDENSGTLRQIRNALEEQVQLQQSEAYFGDPLMNSQFFAKRIEGRDSGRDTPGTTTAGATAGPGMKHTLIGEWPIAGKFAYFPITTPDGSVEVYRRNLESNTDDASFLGGPFKMSDSSYTWYDQTANSFRVWSTTRQPTELGNYTTSNRGAAGDAAMGVSSHTWEGGGNQRAVLTPRQGDDEQINGVGAESWVGKKSNSTGYRITSDQRRPGLAIGRASAAMAAKRANGLQQINAANAKLWARDEGSAGVDILRLVLLQNKLPMVNTDTNQTVALREGG